MDTTLTEVKWEGTRESYLELRSFLQSWVREVKWIENDPRDDSVSFCVLPVARDYTVITLKKGETLYSTDKRIM